nr:Glycosyl transferase domain containing protein [Haemonchus contortus]
MKLLSQTHDIVIRTNEELKRIFQALNGTNDIQIDPCPTGNYEQSMKWDAESLGVFHKSTYRPPAKALKTPLIIKKGAVQNAVSREAVEWMIRVNLTKLIGQFNVGKQAVDEMLMSSLQIADEWEMPGRFTKQCFMDDSVSYGGITRMVQWRKKDSECKAGFLRHSVCVLGTEDLPFVAGYHHILVNKMMPTFDYGAIACVSELLFNRTYLGQNDHPLDMTIYENLPTVRFHNGLNDTNLLCQNLHQL